MRYRVLTAGCLCLCFCLCLCLRLRLCLCLCLPCRLSVCGPVGLSNLHACLSVGGVACVARRKTGGAPSRARMERQLQTPRPLVRPLASCRSCRMHMHTDPGNLVPAPVFCVSVYVCQRAQLPLPARAQFVGDEAWAGAQGCPGAGAEGQRRRSGGLRAGGEEDESAGRLSLQD
jgi:hypothetical protein